MNLASFDDCLAEFKVFLATNKVVSVAVAANYLVWLRSLNVASDGKVMDWVVKTSSIEKAVERLELWICSPQASAYTYKMQTSNVTSAFRCFTRFVMGTFRASDFLPLTLKAETAAAVIASSALMASPDVVKAVCAGSLGWQANIGKGNSYGSWDRMTSCRDVKNRTKVIDGVYRDTNVRAGSAIREAILSSVQNYTAKSLSAAKKLFRNYNACHIYPLPNDSRYYCSIPNLALVPAALASLTDYYPQVSDALKYRSYQLYGFVPDGYAAPRRPGFYNRLQWRKI